MVAPERRRPTTPIPLDTARYSRNTPAREEVPENPRCLGISAVVPDLDAVLPPMGCSVSEALSYVLGSPLPFAAPPRRVSYDSRRVEPGDLFVALPGSHVHGGSFEAEAASRGAVAIISDRPGSILPSVVVPDPRAVLGPLAAVLNRRPSERMDVVGITGTNGKTTTAFLTQYLLEQSGSRAGRITTIDMAWDGEVHPSVRTTPEAPDLQSGLARMVKAGCGAAVVEVSSHGLALARVEGTRFAVGVFTNLGHDHYDFHSDREAYLACKASLFHRERCRVCVVNIDDNAGRQVAGMATCPVVTLSSRGSLDADWQVTAIEYRSDSTGVQVSSPAGLFEAVVPMAGHHNLENALAAFAACHQLGVDVSAVASQLTGFPGVPGRLERVDAGQPFDAFVDFAHNPEGLTAVLAAARMRTRTRGAGRVIVVFGAPGDRDRTKRPLMRKAAAFGADVAIVTTDDPYFEDPGMIIADVMHGAREDDTDTTFLVEPDRARAIRWAVDIAEEGDVILITGRGHETVQNLGREAIPFDDRKLLRQALCVAAARSVTVKPA